MTYPLPGPDSPPPPSPPGPRPHVRAVRRQAGMRRPRKPVKPADVRPRVGQPPDRWN